MLSDRMRKTDKRGRSGEYLWVIDEWATEVAALEAENERLWDERQEQVAGYQAVVRELAKDRRALVAYVRIKRQYDEQQLRGRFKHITQADGEEAWQALSPELREEIGA